MSKGVKKWMEDENNVYIGRKGVVFIDKARFPPKSSIFANPYKVGKDGTNEEVAYKFRKHIITKLETGEITLDQLFELKNKNLGCWCHPLRCHGDILLEIIEEYSNNN